MGKKIKCGWTMGVVFGGLLWPHAVSADLDSWAANAIAHYNGPGYLESQQRHIFSGGSFHLRTPNFGSEPIAAVRLPRFKAGCGGIDMFWGGFNFMDFDYFVQKAQRIISAAPAFAFQYALDAVSPATNGIVNSLENMADMVNGLQMNECGIAKNSVEKVLGALSNNVSMPSVDWPTFLTEEYLAAGTTEGWYQTAQQILGEYDAAGGATPASVRAANLEQLSECPGELVNLFDNEHSLLEYAENHGVNFPAGTNFKQVLRGLIGDVDLGVGADNKVVIQNVPPCVQEKSNPVETILLQADIGTSLQMQNHVSDSGNVAIDYVCVDYPGNDTLNVYTQNMLTNIYNNVINGQALLAGEEDFLNAVPMPVKQFVEQVYIANAPASSLATWVEPVNYGMLSELFANLLYQARKIPKDLENAMAVCRKQGIERCALCNYTEDYKDLMDKINAWAARASEVQKQVEEKWHIKQQNMVIAQALISRVDDLYLLKKREKINGLRKTGE